MKIIIHGLLGRMGRQVLKLAENASDMSVVAGVDAAWDNSIGFTFPVFTSLEENYMPADVIIDFSTASAVDGVIEYAVKNKIALVECTTALSTDTKQRLLDASAHIPVLRSANMSIGVNIINRILKTVSVYLWSSGFDIEIIEKHHNQKADAPSGTASLFAQTIQQSNDGLTPIYERQNRFGKRDKSEIGIHSVRGGTIAGEHSILFCGPDEVIELKHAALSREIFAVGALKAAEFLSGKPAGFYTMEDLF